MILPTLKPDPVTSTRRDFLAHGSGLTTLLATGACMPAFLARTASASATRPAADERILVVVQLTGGNDGLNTLIPFRDDTYRESRPTLAIAPGRTLKLTDDLGLHPEMTGFKRLYDEGQLRVVSNVGYPNPNRSHFRSMDVWHTASTAEGDVDEGWLGRVAARRAQGSHVPLAIHLDDTVLPLALQAPGMSIPSVRDIGAFRLEGDAEEMASAIAAERMHAGEDLLFVQRVALSSCRNAQRLAQVTREPGTPAAYPSRPLAGKLRQIAQLIGADFGPRIYYTSLGGFDTHARQGDVHGGLLRELSASVDAFFRDLAQRRLADRVILMTFSEFGRRVAENAGRGTDHGAAAPMFIAGPACRPGITGGSPDLTDLDHGDVRHETDFRQVYAAVLQDWLAVEPAPILGRPFPPVRVLHRG